MPISTFKIYTIKNINYDEIIAKYHQLCVEGKYKYRSGLSVYEIKDLEYDTIRKPRNGLQDETRIIDKIKYIIHTIAYRQLINVKNDKNGVSVLSDVLRSRIGRDTSELLEALETLGYIKKTSNYVIGKYATHYKIIGDIHSTLESRKTIKKYITKTQDIFKEAIHEKMTGDAFKTMYGNSFAETYIKNLNKFKIDEDGLSKIANRQKKTGKINYYNFIKESFKDDLKIYSIDDNYRFYHILTSLKRDLKQLTNIDYSIDCKNSHPLLFNYFIFSNKDISIELSYLISSILYKINKSLINPYGHHYDIENLCNILNTNGIENQIIAKFTHDELLYLWKTTTGRFWDDIVEENEGKYKRSVIKKRMFAQVFYAKKEKDALFATQFKRDFPNVYALILRWKQPLRHDDLQEQLIERKKAVKWGDATLMSKQETALPNVMMHLESEIFREILKSLYKKRISAVHIHDSIVVPKRKARVEKQQIEDVMRTVYKKFGLYPTFSIDKY